MPRTTPRTSLEIESKVRAKRLGLAGSVTVESRTLGAPMAYLMAADNVSRTGLLLDIGKNHKVPFRINTLLELTVDRDKRFFERPVSCLGKIVRVAQDGDRPQFGVQIVQMEGVDLEAWDKTMTALEISGRDALPAAS